MPTIAPRDQSSNEAPGLPVALSKIAGVTNTPEPDVAQIVFNAWSAFLPIALLITVQTMVQKPNFCA